MPVPTSKAERVERVKTAKVELKEEDRLKVEIPEETAAAETVAQLQLVDFAASSPSSSSSVVDATEESVHLESLRTQLLGKLMCMDMQQAIAMSAAAGQIPLPAQTSAAAQASAPAQASAAAQASAPTQNSAAAQAWAPAQNSAAATPWRSPTQKARTPTVVLPPSAAVAQQPSVVVPRPPPAVWVPGAASVMQPRPPAAKAPRVVPPKQAAAKNQGMCWQHPSGQWLPRHRHTPRGGSSKKSDWHRRWGLAKAAGISWDTFVAEAGPPPPKSAP